ncbi:MAG: hypothetical protein AAF653_15700, partial [Chloroflexota bacterium]
MPAVDAGVSQISWQPVIVLRGILVIWAMCMGVIVAGMTTGYMFPADMIAFESNRGVSVFTRIHLLDLRTAIIHPVTPHAQTSVQPAWSPDGGYLAYQVAPNQDNTWRVDAFALSAPHTVIELVRNAIHPAWSPDGRYIAFSRYDGVYSTNNVHVYDLETRTSTNIAPSRDIAQFLPAWSPYGTQIVISGTSPFNRSLTNIYTFPFMPQPAEPVTFTTVSRTNTASQPVWLSPGDVLFTSSITERNESLIRTPATAHSLDFPVPMPLTFIEYPDVLPDGGRMVFSARDASGTGARSLYIADADGTNIQRLTYPTSNRTIDNVPVWRPRSR